MLQIKRILSVVLVLIIMGISPSEVQAEFMNDRRGYQSAQQMLSHSLDGLRDSAKDIAEKNQGLFAETIHYKRSIGSLQAVLDEYRDRTGETKTDYGLYGKYRQTKQKQQSFVASKYGRLKNEFIKVDSDVHMLESQIAKKTSSLEQMQKDISRLDAEVASLRQTLIESNQGYMKDPKIVSLIDRKIVIEQQLKEAEKEYKSVKKQYSKPIKEYVESRSEQKMLTQQLAIGHDELRIAEETEKKLRMSIEEITNQKGASIEKTKAEILSLRGQEKELSSILLKAKVRLGQSNIHIEDIQAEEIGMLTDNLSTIESENTLLKEEIDELHGKLGEIPDEG